MNDCKVCSLPLDQIDGLQIHPTCELDPGVTAGELFNLIENSIINQPRSLQKRIGPSEVGVPCDRRLGYQLAGMAEVNQRGVAWKPYVGTALHEQFADIMAKAEIARFNEEGAVPRWHVEERVTVGEIGGVSITGSADLFDEATGTVFDWKTTSKNQIRENYRKNGPGPQYRAQAHLYGKGFADAGYKILNVSLIFLTRDGEWEDRYVWAEPYDERIALDALVRANAIHTAIDLLGAEEAIGRLGTTDVYCRNCPFYRPRAKNPAEGCQGHGTTNSSDTAGA
jgi:hypothetical protein